MKKFSTASDGSQALSPVIYPSLLLGLCCCFAPIRVQALTLLVQQNQPYLGYGCGLSSWMSMTMELNRVFGSAQITVHDTPLTDLDYLMGFDRLWITFSEAYLLSDAEVANVQTFIATGRRVVLPGDAFAPWNRSILRTVGSTYPGLFTSGLLTPAYQHPLTTGVTSLDTDSAGLAGPGGISLFNENVVTLWEPAQNVVSVLDVNAIESGWITDTPGNQQFRENLAEWLAGELESGHLLLSCPSDRAVPEEPGACSATVGYLDPILAAGVPPYTVTCGPPSGSVFQVGTTAVRCSASDSDGHSAECGFQMTVLETDLPVIECPPDLVVDCIANVPPPEFTGTVSAACDPNLVVIHVSDVPDGSYPARIARTYQVSDGLGQTASCTQNITVEGLPGGFDLNGDCCVDRMDLEVLLGKIRSHATDPSFDLNHDGKVDIADARFLLLHFTNPSGSPCAKK
jgi:hypothetical protein